MRFCPHCSSLFRGEFEHCAVDGTRLEPVDAGDPLLGRAVDRYRIEALLGSGSTGRVYRAVHRTREERYAIKLIWGDLGADQRLVRRFQRAAAASLRIQHPNVVHIVDSGTTIAGLSFLVMELVDGRSLRRYLDEEGPMRPPRAARVLHQVAEGLAAAHEAGFVHRDVKPANIVLVESEPTPTAKLLDFGLVGLAVAEADARITASGTFVGTPLYMAPEQARSAGEVSPAADVYALGVVLHELLSGKPPFEGETPLEVMIAHSTRRPPPLPPSRGLETLARWAMEKIPARRPPSARVFADELSRYLDAMMREDASGEAPADRSAVTETLELEPVRHPPKYRQ